MYITKACKCGVAVFPSPLTLYKPCTEAISKLEVALYIINIAFIFLLDSHHIPHIGLQSTNCKIVI